MSRTTLARNILAAPPDTNFVVCVSGPLGVEVWCDGDGSKENVKRDLNFWAVYLPEICGPKVGESV
jgi:hypothetical protein